MRHRLILGILFASAINVCYGQEFVLKGHIKDSIPGVIVTIKGTNYSAMTDMDGNFKIAVDRADSLKGTINPKNLKLKLSSVGYTSEDVSIRNYSSRSSNLTVSYEIQSFPWPPPQASAFDVINDNVFIKAKVLSDVDATLKIALDSCGYFQKKYYYVKNGFALVTKLERIHKDGSPFDPPDRWNIDAEASFRFTLKDYLKALFIASKGYFRIIVFIVTDVPFSQSESSINREDAIKWLEGGAHVLPPQIGKLKYTKDYKCTVLIYEFIKPDTGAPVLIDQSSSTLQGKDHLIKSKLIRHLN